MGLGLLLALLAFPALAGEGEKPLKGFTETQVELRVEDGLKALRSPQALLRRKLLASLKGLGIADLKPGQGGPEAPVLSLLASTRKPEPGEPELLKLDLALFESVIRSKDAATPRAPRFTAITYRKALSVSAAQPGLETRFEEAIDRMLADFVLDYSLANARPRPPKHAPSLRVKP